MLSVCGGGGTTVVHNRFIWPESLRAGTSTTFVQTSLLWKHKTEDGVLKKGVLFSYISFKNFCTVTGKIMERKSKTELKQNICIFFLYFQNNMRDMSVMCSGEYI